MTTRSLLYVSAPLDGGYRVCCDGLQYLWLYSLGSRLCCYSTSGRVWKYEIGCKTRVFSIKRFDTTQVPENFLVTWKRLKQNNLPPLKNETITLYTNVIYIYLYMYTYILIILSTINVFKTKCS